MLHLYLHIYSVCLIDRTDEAVNLLMSWLIVKEELLIAPINYIVEFCNKD